ncbi:MAG: ABC transporter permease, partial [Promicromonosporaceae bacterium]|nr:ABC transporter permease [Promicromonosporaceae bacterium]
IWSAIIGGAKKVRWIAFAASFVATIAGLLFVTNTDWLARPRLDYLGVAIIGAGAAFGLTAMMAGLQNRKALYSALTAAGVGLLLMWPMQWVFQPSWLEALGSPWLTLILLALSAVLVGCLIGWLFGGHDRRVSMRVAALTAVAVGGAMFIDRIMQIWPFYNSIGLINHRPIRVSGSSTPAINNVPGYDFWISTLDSATHLILPTITLTLISFAGYTRYSRASLLEVMNQDYIRTARAKGLPERVVTMRHAFRNALIPLATIVPLDFAALLGGAIITERIFAWRGMGTLFLESMNNMDANPVMGYFLVLGTLLVLAAIAVDLVYAALDPRIRVNA